MNKQSLHDVISQIVSYDNNLETDDQGNRFSLVSRPISIHGKSTKITVESETWKTMRDICKREKCSIHDLISLIDKKKNTHTSISAAIRVFCLLYYRAAQTEEGHQKAGHGDFKLMEKRAYARGVFIPNQDIDRSAPPPLQIKEGQKRQDDGIDIPAFLRRIATDAEPSETQYPETSNNIDETLEDMFFTTLDSTKKMNKKLTKVTDSIKHKRFEISKIYKEGQE